MSDSGPHLRIDASAIPPGSRPSRLPYYVYVPEDRAKLIAQSTQTGTYNLTTAEKWWSAREPYFSAAGYALRPRYRANWTPSWLGTNLTPTFCEDAIMLNHYNVLDGVRKKDGAVVSIKITRGDTDEVPIARFLSSPNLLKVADNHCVPLLDVLHDPFELGTMLMVMPYLRPFDDPEFSAIGEVIDFITQTLEGISFLHRHGVAHRDCAAANIMMDGRPLYPHGHHPINRGFSPDGIYELVPLSRIDHPVRYYFIDFGISSLFLPGDLPLVVGSQGRDKEVPELSDDVPYNAFKVDIFILGNLYKTDFIEKYGGFEILEPLIDGMTRRVPEQRLTADEALRFFEGIRATIDVAKMRRRLQGRTETRSERVLYDAVAYAREGVHKLKNLVS